MREVIRPGVVLLLTAVIAALSLSLMREATKDRIAQNAIDARNAAMGEVLPAAERFGDIIDVVNAGSVTAYSEGFAADTLCGYTVTVVVQGYGGAMELLVGIRTDGGACAIDGLRVINHSETPGLGANAKEQGFLSQYENKTGALSVTKSPSPGANEIQAITAATITTKAVTSAVNDALAFTSGLQAGGAQ